MGVANGVLNNQAMCRKSKKKISVIVFGLMILCSFLEYDGFFQLETFIIPAGMIILAGFIEIFLFYQGKVAFNNMHKYLFLFFLVSVLTLGIGIYTNSVNYVLFYFATIIFYYSLTYRSWNINEVRYIINCYYVTGLITAILLITEGALTGTGRYSISIFGNEPLEVNYLAALLCSPAVIAFKRTISKKSKMYMLGNGVIFLIIIYGVFLTGSRAGLLAIMVGALAVLFFSTNSNKNNSIFTLSSFAGIVICLALIYISIDYLPTNIVDRFFVDSYQDASNEKRVTLWLRSLDMLAASPILGLGQDSFPTKHLQYYGSIAPVHNTFLTIMFNSGLIGFGLFFCFLYYAIKDSFRKGNRLLLSIVFNVFITSFIINAILSLYLWINIMIVHQCCNVIKNNDGIDTTDLL